MSRACLLLVCVAIPCAVALTGCGESPPAPGDDDTGDDDTTDPPPCGSELPGTCNRYSTTGVVDIEVEDDGAELRGEFLSAPFPWTPYKLAEQGDCAFYQLDPPPFCDPECGFPLVCGYGDTCRAESERLTVGDALLEGIGPPTSVAPDWHPLYLLHTFDGPVVAGTEIRVHFTGGENAAPFDLCAQAPPALPETDDDDVILHEGVAHVVSWEPASEDSRTRVHLRLTPDYHAYTDAYLECAAEDAAGSLTIPADLVELFVAEAYSGASSFSALLSRQTRDVVETDIGCAELVVRSSQSLYGRFAEASED